MTLLTPLKNDKSAHTETPSFIPVPFKRTIIRPTLLLVLLLFSTSSALAYDCKVDGIYYDLNKTDKTASVTKGIYIGIYSGNIIIPETIAYNNATYSVTSIGESAFYCCTGLTSVTIPNSVTSIASVRNGAFSGCSGLTSVVVDKNNVKYDSRDNCNAIIETSTNTLVAGCKNTIIPNSVTSIGENAFYGCSGLTSVTIPNSVTSIGDCAFSYCKGLTSVAIPNSVTSIGSGAFSWCSGLTSVTIPNSVTTIGEHAFHFCSGLTSVTIPNSVTSTSIGECAFYGCSGLTSVVIGNSVTSIGRNAFTKCDGLTSVIVDKYNSTYDSRDNCNAIIESSTNKLIVGCKNTTIPDSVTSIGNSAFEDCSELTSVTIPNSVTTIGKDAFSGCSGLTSINIPNSVTSIGSGAFSYCSGLTSVAIPNFVTSIGFCTFYMCSRLTSVTIPNSVTTIGKDAFSDCSWLTSVTIPNSVTSIGEGAFCGCDGLTSVVIGNSVTTIRECAFFDCSGLTKLVSLAVEPPICGYDALEYIDKTACRLFVPEESVNKYKAADQWGEFLNILGCNGVDDVSVDTQGAVYEVYNLQGVRVGSGMREAEITADALPHGVYLLVSPSGRKKLKI